MIFSQDRSAIVDFGSLSLWTPGDKPLSGQMSSPKANNYVCNEGAGVGIALNSMGAVPTLPTWAVATWKELSASGSVQAYSRPNNGWSLKVPSGEPSQINYG